MLSYFCSPHNFLVCPIINLEFVCLKKQSVSKKKPCIYVFCCLSFALSFPLFLYLPSSLPSYLPFPHFVLFLPLFPPSSFPPFISFSCLFVSPLPSPSLLSSHLSYALLSHFISSFPTLFHPSYLPPFLSYSRPPFLICLHTTIFCHTGLTSVC